MIRMNLATIAVLLALMAADTQGIECFQCVLPEKANISDPCYHPTENNTAICESQEACLFMDFVNLGTGTREYKRACYIPSAAIRCYEKVRDERYDVLECCYCQDRLCNNMTAIMSSIKVDDHTTFGLDNNNAYESDNNNAGTHNLSPWLFTTFVSTITLNLMFC